MSDFRISQGSWNGGTSPGWCCHCGLHNCHTSIPPGGNHESQGALICGDCFEVVRRFNKDGTKRGKQE